MLQGAMSFFTTGMKQILKNIFFRCAALFPQEMDGKASILMYHSVKKNSEHFFAVSPDKFREQMQFLHKEHREVITFAELLSRMEHHTLRGGEVVISFDDGYRDNFTDAFPVLQEYKFPATIFVTTGLIGKRSEHGEDMLTASDIRVMHASGLIDFEPHSVSHPKLAKLDKAFAKKEIVESKEYLETLLMKSCEFFAYPYGNHTDETVGIVRDMGFKAAVTVREGSVSSGVDPLRLRRNSIDKLTTLTQFLGKISRSVDWYQKLKRA